LGVFDAIGDRGHEEVIFGHDAVSGLRTVIAIHSTALGPALGGTRFHPFASEQEALADALCLSEAMTYKAAVAGLDLGGGKAVIIGDPLKDKTERLWRAYGRVVDSLHGRFIAAADVGSDDIDMEIVKRETRWVVGTRVREGGAGDPSPATARGLIGALRAVSRFLWDTEELAGRRVAVMGVGKVGGDFVRRLTEADVSCVVADTYPPAIERITAQFDVEVVDPESIYEVSCDVFSPCSLGGALNKETIPRLKCSAVVGAANNQLATGKDASLLEELGILYAPDFVVNGGGLINVAEEIHGFEEARAGAHIDKVYDNTRRVLETAAEKKISPHAAAREIAEERIRGVGSLRLWRRSGDDRN